MARSPLNGQPCPKCGAIHEAMRKQRGKAPQPRCQKHSKRTQQQCNAVALAGKDYCRVHGGGSLSGAAHPNAKHLRYSEVMPPRWLERARAAIEDPELLSLLPNLALVDAQIGDALEELQAGDAEAWTQLRQLAREAQQALREGEKSADRALQLVQRVLQLAQEGGGTEVTLARLGALQEQRRRLVESEVKRAAQESASLSADRVLSLLQVIIVTVFQTVRDPRQQQTILNDVHRITMGQLPPSVEEAAASLMP